MQVTDSHKFKNEASRRFYLYVDGLTKKSDADKANVFRVFGLSDQKNPWSFLSQLKSGQRSVTVDQVYIAKKELGLNPGYLFESSDQETIGFASNIVEDNGEPVGYSYGLADAAMKREIGKKFHELFKKHKLKIEPYAQQRLNITKQAMYDKLNGKTNISFDEAMVICEDTGESLDQFRRTPLPKGHHLQQMQMMNEMIEMLKAENASLKKQLKSKK